MTELGDDFRAMREYRRTKSEQRRKRNTNWMDRFQQQHPEHEIEELTPYHYRIDDELDIYVTNQRYHNLTTGDRGFYKTLPQICHEQLHCPKCDEGEKR